MWSTGCADGYMAMFRDTLPNKETELIGAFTASTTKGGGGQLSVIPNSCSPPQRSQWLSAWCEHCIETHAAGWTCNYQTWSCLLRRGRGQGDCVSFFFCFSAQWSKWRSVKSWRGRRIWEEEDESGRGRGQRERETWGERDKGERDNQTHTCMNTHTRTHTHSHTIVTEHNSEVTTVLFFLLLCQ